MRNAWTQRPSDDVADPGLGEGTAAETGGGAGRERDGAVEKRTPGTTTGRECVQTSGCVTTVSEATCGEGASKVMKSCRRAQVSMRAVAAVRLRRDSDGGRRRDTVLFVTYGHILKESVSEAVSGRSDVSTVGLGESTLDRRRSRVH